MTVKEMHAFYSLLEKQYTRGYRDGQDAQSKEGYIQNCYEQVNNFENRIMELTEELENQKTRNEYEKVETAEIGRENLGTRRSATSTVLSVDQSKIPHSGVASETQGS